MSIFIPKTAAASAGSIAYLQDQFGGSLPGAYLAFVKEHDGAKPEDNVFEIGPGNSAGIDRFIPSNENSRIRETVEGFPRHALAFASATGGNFVYIDPATGAVYFWDHEIDSGDTKLANSLGEFLEKLQPFDINQVRLKPGQVKKLWVNPGFKPKF